MNDSGGAAPPGGRQFSIAWKDHLATVTEVGATLREYRVGSRPVIDGFAAGEMCSGGRGQVLMPWPNRIAGGKYEFESHRHQLALTEPQRGNAIHGLVRWAPWRLVRQTGGSIELELTLHPQPGYPFTLHLSIGYGLSADGLRVTARAANLGVDPAPFGAGSHPYLKPLGEFVDESILTIPATSYLEVDERLIPTGRRLPVDGSALDFRKPRRLGEALLDTCFCDFEAPRITLDDLQLWWDAEIKFAQCFSGDALGLGRRRRGLAVEPMTCPPDAFNSRDELIVLQPAQEWMASWGISLAGDG